MLISVPTGLEKEVRNQGQHEQTGRGHYKCKQWKIWTIWAIFTDVSNVLTAVCCQLIRMLVNRTLFKPQNSFQWQCFPNFLDYLAEA
jgi:hypothetical protein